MPPALLRPDTRSNVLDVTGAKSPHRSTSAGIQSPQWDVPRNAGLPVIRQRARRLFYYPDPNPASESGPGAASADVTEE